MGEANSACLWPSAKWRQPSLSLNSFRFLIRKRILNPDEALFQRHSVPVLLNTDG